MKTITRNFTVPLSPEAAFRAFVHDLQGWWPKEYTWSQEHLVSIQITPSENGLCTEIGPHGFRADWGRVTTWQPPQKLVLLWQIGPTRAPQPNPAAASEISIAFLPAGKDETAVIFTHSGFERHGQGAEAYAEAMDSDKGWDYILAAYRQFCRQ